MKAFHTTSLARSQDRGSWYILLSDNWHAFGPEYAELLEKLRVLKLSTPEGFSMAYNWLDVLFHGRLKLDQAKDRATDKSNPLLREYFLTKTGKLKAGNQVLSLANFVKRFKDVYNHPSREPQYRTVWQMCGYGMSKKTQHNFLKHAFGYAIGEDTKVEKEHLAGGVGGRHEVNPFNLKTEEAVSLQMKSGPKRKRLGSNVFRKDDIRSAKDAFSSAKNMTDLRTSFLYRLWKTVDGFEQHVREEFDLHTPGEFHRASISKQRAIARLIRTSTAPQLFDPWTQDAKVQKDRHQLAKERTQQKLAATFSSYSSAIRTSLRTVLDAELAEKKKEHDDTIRRARLRNILVKDLRRILERAGLSSDGSKKILVKRVWENNVPVPDELLAVPSDELSESRRDAIAAWSKLRKKQLAKRLEVLNMDSKGTKDALAIKMASAVQWMKPSEWYIEFDLPGAGGPGGLDRRLRAMHRGTEMKGTTFESTLWNLAVYIVHNMRLDVYGGFPRDTLVRGKYHLAWGKHHCNEDIDVAVPADFDGVAASRRLTEWCNDNKCTLKKTRDILGNAWMVEHLLRTPDDEDLVVQFVAVEKLHSRDGGADFDVNCMKISAGKLTLMNREIDNLDLNTVVRNTINKTCVRLKQLDDLSDKQQQLMVKRTRKMKGRRWHVTNEQM